LELAAFLRRRSGRTARGLELGDQPQAPGTTGDISGDDPWLVTLRVFRDTDAIEAGKVGGSGHLVQVIEEVETLPARISHTRGAWVRRSGALPTAFAGGLAIAAIAAHRQLPDEFGRHAESS
jgi:hypothetical protein